MNLIIQIVLWIYVVSMIGAAIFCTFQMHEVEDCIKSTDSYFVYRSKVFKQCALFGISAIFVFVPIMNTMTLLGLLGWLAVYMFGEE